MLNQVQVAIHERNRPDTEGLRNVVAEASASRLQQAQQALRAAEWEERRAQQQLTVLERHEQQLRSDLRKGTGATKPSGALHSLHLPRAPLDDLPHQKALQVAVVRQARHRLQAAQRTHAELERRALDLQYMIRREARAVAQWQQQIVDTEHQLRRWRQMLADAQARLEQAQRGHTELKGSS